MRTPTGKFVLAACLLVLGVSAGCGGGSTASNNSNNGGGSGGDASIIATISAGAGPQAVVVNATTNKIYVANYGSPGSDEIECLGTPGSVTEIDGASNSSTTVNTGSPGGPYPIAIALDPATNTAYLLSQGHVIADGECFTFHPFELDGYNGATLAGSKIDSGMGTNGFAPAALAVDSGANSLYVANHCCGNVLVVDGTSETVMDTVPIAAGVGWAVAVNSTTHKIYVAGNGVSVIDGATNDVTSIAGLNGSPGSLAVNETTNKIYAAYSSSNVISVIDGATGTATTITVPSAAGLGPMAVNPVSNKVYALNPGGNSVTVIDGATNSLTSIPAGTNPIALAVNPDTNFVYVANLGNKNDAGSVTVINGSTNSTATLTDPLAANPIAVAVSAGDNKIYVANSGSKNVTVIAGAQ